MNGVIEMCSIQFPKRAQWHIREIGEKTGDWADYLRGATWALSNRFPLTVGLSGVIEGSLPIGGLSSSAAVILSFLDCKDNSYELIPTNPNMKPYKIAVFFSGLEHSLAGSKYNMRVDELRSGVYALQAFAGLEYGKFNEANARDVSYEIYQTYKDKLPAQWARRCEHWYTEFKRVEAGAEAWRRGDLEEYGRLSFESGWSSIHNWESGAPEQIKLYEIMRETNGIYGGRFSGAGFKGCCMALIDPSKTDVIREEVERKYLTAFPEMRGKYSFHLCESADGVGHKAEG